jgi:uncharacterized protein YgiM (DUF1202 family)
MLLPLVFAMFAAPSNNAVVLQPVANMYSQATTDSDVVSQAIYATNVTILEQRSGWLKVRTPDDYSGWMPETVVLRTQPYAKGSHVVSDHLKT